MDRLLKVGRVAELLGLSPKSVWTFAAENRIPKPVKVGRRAVRWRESDVQAFIQSGVAEQAPESQGVDK